ncbi:MAG TPA: hypothetical protein VHJ83_07905, partial [Micromonosporaceae bacterium]|nr:hypothetical protein [Micromonosporaceae bacterium]
MVTASRIFAALVRVELAAESNRGGGLVAVVAFEVDTSDLGVGRLVRHDGTSSRVRIRSNRHPALLRELQLIGGCPGGFPRGRRGAFIVA